MTVIGIFGDGTCSEALVKATLDDALEAHQRTTPDDAFELNIGIRDNPGPVLPYVMEWAERGQIDYSVYRPSSKAPVPESASYVTNRKDVFGTLVEHLPADGRVLALIGADDPQADVGRALITALDSGKDVRDLAEGGITLVGIKGEPPTEGMAMATEEETEYTWQELGEFADDPDHENYEAAMAVLKESAEEVGLDPDDYATLVELAQALEDGEKDVAAASEPVEEDEPQPDEPGWTRESLKGKGVKELREIAKASGVADYAKRGVKELIDALTDDAGPEPESDGETFTEATLQVYGELTDADVDRIATAVVATLAKALSS